MDENREEPGLSPFRRLSWKVALLWAVLPVFVLIGTRLGWDKELIAAGAIFWGIVTHIFAAALAVLIGWIAAVPLLGPLLVKILTWPLFLLVNGLAFLASLVGLNVGEGRKVFEARVAATILAIGMLIGFVLGRLL